MARVRRLGHQSTTESQKLSDMLRAWRHLARDWLDHIVEAKLQTIMLAVSAECGWYPPSRIEDRDHMAYPSLAMFGQFLDAANGDLEGSDRCIATRAVHPRPKPGGIFMALL
jgi:hypothetical protein